MLRVLIVEDNRNFREIFRNELYDHFPSMAIEEAESGEEALQKIGGDSFHLVFVDIRLPGMNGLQLTQKVKNDFPKTYIAILTSYDLPEYREASLQYGADRFFVKSSLKWDEVAAFVESIRPEVP